MKLVIDQLDNAKIHQLVDLMRALKERGGRLFFIGLGGGAGNSIHAVCDFSKLVGIETYTVMDNVASLTAQINDNGWEFSIANLLRERRLRSSDMVFVFSVGGGSLTHNISSSLVRGLQYAKHVQATIAGIVGRDGGYTATVADVCVIIPTVNCLHITPHTEVFQAAIWHLLVTHPKLLDAPMKWESVTQPIKV